MQSTHDEATGWRETVHPLHLPKVHFPAHDETGIEAASESGFITIALRPRLTKHVQASALLRWSALEYFSADLQPGLMSSPISPTSILRERIADVGGLRCAGAPSGGKNCFGHGRQGYGPVALDLPR